MQLDNTGVHRKAWFILSNHGRDARLSVDIRNRHIPGHSRSTYHAETESFCLRGETAGMSSSSSFDSVRLKYQTKANGTVRTVRIDAIHLTM